MTALRVTPELLRERATVTESGCWEYLHGCIGNPGGYRSAGGDWAHRTAYRLFVGPIPAGMEIDHLCFNPPCVNPAHLEPVTPAENKRRAFEHRTHCGNGHPWDEVNTRVNARGFRECRSCHRDREAERKARIRAGVTAPPNVKPEQHGTKTGYEYGCRCVDCNAANAAYSRAYRAKARPVRPDQHGTRTGYAYGCRCRPCRDSQVAHTRARRALKAAA